MSLPYTRAYHPEDYMHASLAPHAAIVRQWETELQRRNLPYRKDHEARVWEYANVVRQLTELAVPRGSTILDVGFGANFFTPWLRQVAGMAVTANDSMAYGDCTPWLIDQCLAFGIEIPLNTAPLESLAGLADASVDVVSCISVIEHIPMGEPTELAWGAMLRVLKPGGYLFLTSDYFKDREAWEASKFRAIQHVPYDADYVANLPAMLGGAVEFVGPIDLHYRGDWVWNYSFVNVCLRRVR